MMRLTFLLRRKAGTSVDAFQRICREEHAPLVAGFAATLGIRRYVQVHTRGDELAELDRDPSGR